MGELSESQVRPPEKLLPAHDLTRFDCGEPSFDDWLRRQAARNEAGGAARTYVVCCGETVAGYYSLAVGAVAHAGSSGRVKRNMPDPIPVMILARLAVDREFQGRGIGVAMLRDAVLRTLQAAEIAGIRALLVQAISERAMHFYESNGFRPSPLDPMTVMITLEEVGRTAGGTN